MSAILPNVIQLHVEEAGLLWLRRDLAAGYPDFSLKELADLDGQIEAHLDGMRIAGDVAWQIAEGELRWQAAGEVFAASMAALENGDAAHIERVLAEATTSHYLARPFISALGWLPPDQARGHWEKSLASSDPSLRYLGIAAAAIHRHDPGDALATCIQDEDSALHARSLRAIGELGRLDLLPLVRSQLNSPDEAVRFSAAWSAALLEDNADAVQVLKACVEQGNAPRGRAWQLVARRMPSGDAQAWIEQLAAHPTTIRSAIQVAGAAGDPVMIPWLLEQLRHPSLARLAGGAMSLITGVGIVYQNLGGEWPEGFEAGPTEDPADDNVALDEDEHFPWPDIAKLTAWWEASSSRFEPGMRYVAGLPITRENMSEILRRGKQPQRTAAALELAILQPGQPLFETRAPGFCQQALLR